MNIMVIIKYFTTVMQSKIKVCECHTRFFFLSSNYKNCQNYCAFGKQKKGKELLIQQVLTKITKRNKNIYLTGTLCIK